MTITFVGSHYPRKLEKYLAEKRHYHFEKSDDGIYQIIGNEFAMQFIVTSQISKEENLWIWSMNNSINDVRITEKLLNEYRENKNNKHYESIMDIIINANPKTFMEDRKMCKALEEIFKVQIQEAKVQTKIEDILEYLKKLGELPEKLQEKISNEKELEVLKHWYSMALDVNSIEEFQNAM